MFYRICSPYSTKSFQVSPAILNENQLTMTGAFTWPSCTTFATNVN